MRRRDAYVNQRVYLADPYGKIMAIVLKKGWFRAKIRTTTGGERRVSYKYLTPKG